MDNAEKAQKIVDVMSLALDLYGPGDYSVEYDPANDRVVVMRGTWRIWDVGRGGPMHEDSNALDYLLGLMANRKVRKLERERTARH